MTQDLRSAQWYGGDDRNAYIHRAWMRRGLPADAFSGRPHIAIANTASDLTPCNSHLNEVAAAVRDGIFEAGGIPLNLPVVSLSTRVRLKENQAFGYISSNCHTDRAQDH